VRYLPYGLLISLASIDGTFYNFLVTLIVRMIRAKNYQKFSKFVKVTAKILSVHFMGGHGVYC